jgi:Protein of unknown function (DUF2961)
VSGTPIETTMDPSWPGGRGDRAMTTWAPWMIVAVLAFTASACGGASAHDRGGSEQSAGDAAAGPYDGGTTAHLAQRLPPSLPSAYFDGGILPDLPAAVGAGAITDVDSLPFLQLDEHSRHASSYDRSGGNADYGNAYGVDSAGNWIVLDARGPGCVYRIWFTGFAATDEIHVYFDDETTPRIEMTLAQFFGGHAAPFTAPLVGDATISSGGFFSYVPLPFAESIRITVTPNSGVYYNIDFHALPADAQVSTWTGAEDLSAARSVWASAGSDPKPGAPDGGGSGVESTFDLAPTASQSLFDGAGPGELSAIELRIPGVLPAGPDAGAGPSADGGLGPTAAVLDQLWVDMEWDDQSTPSVLATVGSLFALGDLGAGASGGLMAGLRADGTLYLYFPMPFARHAHVGITNDGQRPVTGVWARVESRPFRFSFDEVGTFAVQYQATPSTLGSDLTLLDTAGSGKVVGVVLSETRQACSNCIIRDYLEGDEHVLVDSARTPVVLGTGTEDFFNGGFYFYYGPFGLPSHGNVVHAAPAAFDATSAYRFFISDSISFRDHLRLSLQHGPTDNDDVVASSLVYYYRQTRSRLELSDAFVVGDAAGEQSHMYQATDPTWSGSLEATFEGEFSTQPVTSTGRSDKGTSSFVMQSDPANSGVVLRRLLNQGTGNQRAQVFVGGALVGDWLTSGANLDHAWREDDFAIPGSVTAGKSSLAIEVRFVSSDVDWTEFQYELYSQLP